MDFAGSYYFDADQQTVWDLLMDPQSIAAASPGVDKLIPLEGEINAWKAFANITTAMISGTFYSTIRLTECEPIEHYRLTVCGEGQGTIFNGSACVSLSYDEGLEQTIIRWEADGDISDNLSRIGQPIIKVAANLLTKQFFRNLTKQHPSNPRKEEIGEHRSLDQEVE